MQRRFMVAIVAAAVTLTLASTAPAQETRPPRGPQGPEVISPEVTADRKVTFRVRAPKAESVRLAGGDLPGVGRGLDMTENDEGIWEVTVGPVEPGAYRYHFQVDEVPVIDPRNPATSESNANTWSLVYVPGSDYSDTKDVPHGAVSEVTYYSDSLDRFRRMHVYTPPGYESGEGKYPVFYLLHGASDSDNSWSTVGRAGFILDNLIAEGKAKPMIVVMPAGHTGPFRFGGPRSNSLERQVDSFAEDFVNDLRPYVEKHYRVLDDRENRAIAGLSMGGAQTLNVAIPNLDEYGYIGVFSSGIFGIAGRPGGGEPNRSWEERHQQVLDDAKQKEGLKLVWFATGKDDFLLNTSRATVDMLKQHGFDVVYEETEGGHTWINWRDYLRTFAPLLFRDTESPQPKS